MVTWGLWQTSSKPNLSTYLIPLCQERINLKSNGFGVMLNTGVGQCKAILVLAIVDLMAKAPLLGVAYHNGNYGCSSCEEPEQVVNSGKGTARSYPPKVKYELRDTTEFLHTANKVVTTRTEELGIRTLSPLLSLEFFDIVNGVVPDYMHGILLGITKNLITLWTKSKYYKCGYYIGTKVKILERGLQDMMPNDYVQRMPRKFQHSWKASEYQEWLLYFALPCLDGILQTQYYEHFSMIVSAIYKLLSDTISEADLICAERELKEFYMQMPALYGFEQCGLNVHNAGAHLCSYVRMWGPLWAWSCFSYEDMSGNVLSRVHDTGNVSIQALKMLPMQKILRTTYLSMPNIRLRSFVAEMLRSSQMPRKLTKLIRHLRTRLFHVPKTTFR
ncbi:hypothetical protein SNE40_011561 [Patella caerulea]|uniref:Uncharacterized protein n=1 Tax=Patella caerulea TaxID=87958 RepID=A0AAN8JNQ9_PATCE